MPQAEVLRLHGQQHAMAGHGQTDPGREADPAHLDGPGRLQPGPVHARHPQDVSGGYHGPHGHGELRAERSQYGAGAGPPHPHPGGPGVRSALDRHHADSPGQALGGARAHEDGVVPRAQIVEEVPADALDPPAPMDLREHDGDLGTFHGAGSGAGHGEGRPRDTSPRHTSPRDTSPPVVAVVRRCVGGATTQA